MGCAWCARLLVSVRVSSGGFRLGVLLGGGAGVVWWSVWGSWWLSWRGFWRSAACVVGGVVLGAGGLVGWRSAAGGAVAGSWVAWCWRSFMQDSGVYASRIYRGPRDDITRKRQCLYGCSTVWYR